MVGFGGSGNRYLYSGEDMPKFFPWSQDHLTFDFENPRENQKDMHIDEPKNVNHDFLKELISNKCFSRLSFEKWERIMHSHGASLREVFNLKFHKFERYVDVVVYPTTIEQVESIVNLSNTHNVILIPYGGGTNVTQALYLIDG